MPLTSPAVLQQSGCSGLTPSTTFPRFTTFPCFTVSSFFTQVHSSLNKASFFQPFSLSLVVSLSFLFASSFAPVFAAPSQASSQNGLSADSSANVSSLGFQDDLLDRPPAKEQVVINFKAPVKQVRTEEEEMSSLLNSPKMVMMLQPKGKDKGKDEGKAPSTLQGASPSSLSKTDLKTIALKATVTATSEAAKALSQEKPSELKAAPNAKETASLATVSAPETPETLQSYYRLEHAAYVGEVVIRTIVNEKTGEAGLMINEEEVAHFRSEYEGAPADLRAKRAAQRLFDYLISGGTYSGVSVKSSYDRKVTTVTLNNTPLLQVDATTALKAKHASTGSLAKVWAEQLRSALGAPEPVEEKPVQILAMHPQILTGGVSRQINGMASWYGPYFHGRRTASGTRYNMYEMTAAHKSLPFGTKVQVTNQKTGQRCVVTITDRGPYVGARVIDLSKAAAAAVGMMGSGVARVTLDILGR